MGYKGGKGQSGVPQAIINLMRPHRRYFEGCLGGGSILSIKRPAPGGNWGIDVDAGAIAAFRVARSTIERFPDGVLPNLVTVDVSSFLKIYPFDKNDLIYLDPPYLFETRRSQRPIYKYEMTIEQHLEILSIILTLPAGILISGYESDMYNEMLFGWRKEHFNAVDRRGNVRVETVWINYPEPLELHDYRFLGKDFRERYKIKQKIKTLEGKLERMPAQERYAMLGAVQNFISRAENGEKQDG